MIGAHFTTFQSKEGEAVLEYRSLLVADDVTKAVGRVREGDERGVQERAQDVRLRTAAAAACPARGALLALFGVAAGGRGAVRVLGEGGAGLELDHLDAEGGAEELLGAAEDDVELARARSEDCGDG